MIFYNTTGQLPGVMAMEFSKIRNGAISGLGFFSFVFLVNCERNRVTGPSGLSYRELADSVQSLYQEIQDSIFTPDCSVCHFSPYAPHDLRLTPDSTRTDMVGRPSKKLPGFILVYPGKSDSSYLIWKLEGREEIAGAPMPNLSVPLSREKINLIKIWIDLLGRLDTLT